jgi:hypothetical protein
MPRETATKNGKQRDYKAVQSDDLTVRLLSIR